MNGIQGKNVFLDSINLSEIKKIYDWKNNKELCDFIGSTYKPISLFQIEDWLIKNQNDSNQVMFGIYTNEDNNFIGIVRLMFINWVNRNTELGIFIGENEYQSKGFGKEILSLVSKYAFNTINLNKIYLKVSISNERAVNLYKSFNFEIEGVLKKHFFINNKFEDVNMMSLFKNE